MIDHSKTLQIISYLLEYPDAEWREEFSLYRQMLGEVSIPQNRDALAEFFDYVEEQGFAAYEEEYVRSFDFSQNTNLYLTMHDRTDFGKQANEMVVFKQMFLDHGFDITNELPDYLPAILELASILDRREAFTVLAFAKQKIELLRNRLIKAKLPHVFLLDVVLTVMTRLEEQ